MFTFVRPGFWALFFTEFHCYHCGSREGYVSRPRNLLEKYGLRPFFLRPVRCGDCYRRSWCPVTVPLLPRLDAIRFDAEERVASAQAADRKETQGETRPKPEDHQRIA
jgi:hypothetical protein